MLLDDRLVPSQTSVSQARLRIANILPKVEKTPFFSLSHSDNVELSSQAGAEQPFLQPHGASTRAGFFLPHTHFFSLGTPSYLASPVVESQDLKPRCAWRWSSQQPRCQPGPSTGPAVPCHAQPFPLSFQSCPPFFFRLERFFLLLPFFLTIEKGCFTFTCIAVSS
jgi:hypothetical protein